MKCPVCGGECTRDEADVTVGIIYGLWYCTACPYIEPDPREVLADMAEAERRRVVVIGNRSGKTATMLAKMRAVYGGKS